MRSLFWLPVLGSLLWTARPSIAWAPAAEIEHFPGKFTTTMTPYINGTDTRIPGWDYTPDYRVEEPVFTAFKPDFYKEENRPYRISPHYKQTSRWNAVRNFFALWNPDKPWLLGCYCTTVYKRLTPLAGCAVITTRHILTTATSTELVLKGRRHYKTLENILGAWYDNNANVYNSSFYMTPARIHYHPRYVFPQNVNRSHPLPSTYDLSVWAATYRFQGSFWTLSKACICQRGGPGWFEYSSSTPRKGELEIIVGFQFMWAYKRKPMPWYKYAVRTRQTMVPCPKTEWGWFHCVYGKWAPLGLDSGAAMHRALEGYGWRFDGLIGLNAFSMRLRSIEMVHYFTVLNTHPVLDWLYASYMGRLKYQYLDHRFYDSQWKAPVIKPYFWLPWTYPAGVQHSDYSPPPWW